MELTDIEKQRLERFWLDIPTRDLILKFILSTFDAMDILTFKGTNLQVGEKVNAIREGKVLFTTGFNLMAQFVRPEKQKPIKNPAI